MSPLSERAKKILLLTLLLGVTLGIAAAMYFLFFRTSPTASPTPAPVVTAPNGTLPGARRAQPSTGATATPGTLPTGANVPGAAGTGAAAPVSRTTSLVDFPTEFAAAGAISATSNSALRFYNPADGKFYATDLSGNTNPLSDHAFYNVETVSWANTNDRAILEFPDGSNVLFDFTQNRQATLPNHWQDFHFSPDDQQITAKSVGNNETNRYLVVSNPDGSNPQAVQELGNNADKVETTWSPSNQVVAYAHTGAPLGMDREQVVLVGKNHENFPGLVTEGRGLIPSWSPTGKSLLYSVYTSQNGYLPELWITSGDATTINTNRKRLLLNTWADKCGWSGDSVLVCAVPSSLETGAGLQRDIANKGPDQIYKIDLKTSQKTNLGTVDGSTDISHVTVSADGQTAYLVDHTSGHISSFNLRASL
ncbi:hypothetical protein KBB27_00515 [Patescibacteria group bacterium]|nr:hypothetical protein [Patescibacteria group bacterium]